MRKLWRRLQKKSHGASPEPTSEVIPLPIPEPTVDLIPSLDRLPQIRKDILKPSNLVRIPKLLHCSIVEVE